MTADRTTRLYEIGAVLAERVPSVLDAAILLLESVPRALDAARPERYEILRPIGAGGQAEVLLGAQHGAEGFQRPVAIKRVRSEATDAGRSTARLRAEALHTAALLHPNVVSALDLDRDRAGQLLLVMEYVDGVDLATLAASGPVPPAVVIFIVGELLSGLGYLHDLRGEGRVPGLVHRDVAPDNVLLSREGAVKLVDFGLARALIGDLTAAAPIPSGKAGYMSPEQARGDELDGRSDLYAVGILLWELLACRRLGVGEALQLPVQAAFGKVPRPSEVQPGVPEDLEAVAMRLLAFDRGDRYEAAELAACDLARCQAASCEGRSELVRLLAERFPRSGRRGPSSAPELDRPSGGPITLTDPSAPTGVLPARDPGANGAGDGQARTGTRERRPQRWWGLVFGVLLALALVAALVAALLVAR
jgi:serine/threonine protein kinase